MKFSCWFKAFISLQLLTIVGVSSDARASWPSTPTMTTLGTADTLNLTNNNTLNNPISSVTVNGGTINVLGDALAFGNPVLVNGATIHMNFGEVNINGWTNVGNMTIFGTNAINLSTVNIGGNANDTNSTIGNFGVQNIAVGATSNNAAILVGGLQNVDGLATNATIAVGGAQVVNGTATGTTIAGGEQFVHGSASNTIIQSGEQFVYGTTTNTIMHGGEQYVRSGGTATGTTISNGEQIVRGQATDTIIESGGLQRLHDMVTIAGQSNYVRSGGVMLVETGNINRSLDARVNFEGGMLRLGGNGITGNFTQAGAGAGNLAIRGNGIIDFWISSGASDFFYFDNIVGNFGTNFRFSTTDIDNLNILGSIDIIQNNAAAAGVDASMVNFTGGVDIGNFNWEVRTVIGDDPMDLSTYGIGFTSLVRTDRVSSLQSNTLRHTFAVNNMVNRMNSSMQHRVGELQWLGNDPTILFGDVNLFNQFGTQHAFANPRDQVTTGGDYDNGFWVRGFTGNTAMDNLRQNVHGMEFGYDRRIVNTENNKILIGILGYAAMAQNELATGHFMNDSSDMTAFGVGVYGIWLGRGGWFADTSVRQHFIQQDVVAYAAGQMDTITFGTAHTASSMNLSFGRQMLYNTTDKFTWFFTPYASVSGAYIMGDAFTMSNGAEGRMNDNFTGQAGAYLMAGPRWRGGRNQKTQLYVRTGYTQDLHNQASVNFNGQHLQEYFDTSGFEIGGGFNYRDPEKRVMIYIEAVERMGRQFREFSGTAGLRYEF